MKGQNKTMWELAQGATYHEWHEWFFEHGSDTLFFAVGMIVAILVTNLLSTAAAIFAAGFMFVVGFVFFVGSFHLKDNHNQVE